MRRSHCRISIPILLIATLHFIVYFVAATQTDAHTFLVRESANTKQLSIHDIPSFHGAHAHAHATRFSDTQHTHLALVLALAARVSPLDPGRAPDPRLSRSSLRTALARSRLSLTRSLTGSFASSLASDSESDSTADASASASALPPLVPAFAAVC